MDSKKIERINYLARKSRTAGLTGAEKAEQNILRNEYRAAVIANLKATLDAVEIVDELPAASGGAGVEAVSVETVETVETADADDKI